MSDDESGPTIVVNDLLSFMSFKRKDISKDRLLRCLRKFYPKEEGEKARSILISSLPDKKCYIEIEKNISETNDPFAAIYDLLDQVEEIDFPMFVCKNLNNVPTYVKEVRIKESRKSEIRKEHRVIKKQINEVFQTLYELKEEVQIISETPVPNGEAGAVPYEVKLERESDNEWEDSGDEEFGEVSGVSEYEDEDELRTDLAPLIKKFKQEYNESNVNLQIISPEEILGTNTQQEEYMEGRTPYYTIKHIFDEYIGYFAIMICSECHFYSNDEDTLLQHNCNLTPIEYGLQQTGIWDELDFERAKQLEKEERLREKEMKQMRMRQKATERRQKSFEIYESEQRCPLCGTKVPVPEWKQHVRYCPGDGTTIPQNHYCNICDVFYADQSTLKIHQGYHDESRPYECLQCKFRFLTQADVDKHFNKHIPEKVTKTKCPFCPFPVLRNASLTEHIKSHTGDRPHDCKICGAKFTNKHKLRKHLNTHNRKEYHCDMCNKIFKSQGTMLLHRQYHSAERPFRCPICNKGFVDSKAMARHQRKHTEEFSCPHCSFKAETAQALKEHVEKHNNCMLCDFKTTHKNIYLKHMMDHHPEALLSD